MTKLRAGTRGSDLALWQTRWVHDRLLEVNPSLEIQQIIIATHGDTATEQLFDANWPVGGFVGAIEQQLASKRIDYAVHSYKDLQTAVTAGLIIAAVPVREVVHDVLVTREPLDLDHLPKGLRIGTSSPRRSAQLRAVADVEIVPIRGNVPTRVGKVDKGELDAVVLAGAGVKRLSINPNNVIELPPDRFVPAPAQGALAIQARENSEAARIVASIDKPELRRAIDAERAVLEGIHAGCHTPVGALAKVDGEEVTLHAQLFSDDGERMVERTETGDDPRELGLRLAKRLLADLGSCR
ncbi:MAG: hydroxymethylbilane synthase [Planctomycetes bacterium]|nr:hydroxymethylbilane synthase [Planctomycetota bacterium]